MIPSDQPPAPAPGATAPPPPAAPDPGFTRLDGVLVGLLLLLAFFLATFATRNSDFYLHLASGRHLAQGLGNLGSDPFTIFGAEQTEVQSSWLFDLVLYEIQARLGESAVVVFKGLLSVALALVLLVTCRPWLGWKTAVACVALTMLTLSTRLLVQPASLSLLFLAITMWLLWPGPTSPANNLSTESRDPSPQPPPRSGEGELKNPSPQPPPRSGEGEPESPSQLRGGVGEGFGERALRGGVGEGLPSSPSPLRGGVGEGSPHLWLLPPLFLLWANCDGWFILGPLVLLLTLLGEGLSQLPGPATVPTRLRTLGLVLLVGLLACLVNPFTYRVFILPTELAWMLLPVEGLLPPGMLVAGTALHTLGSYDVDFLRNLPYWHSPLAQAYWGYQLRGLNIAGFAYFVLLLLGGASFLLLWQRRRRERRGSSPQAWAHLLVFLTFAGFSLGLARLIPFFAVVAGPLLALNFNVQAQTIPATTAHRRRVAGLGLALVLLVLLVLNWPGWLHTRLGDPQGLHRVGFTVYPDPSLQQAAEQLERWGQTGVVKRVFNLNPDLGSYCAWFAPSIRYTLDYRFALLGTHAEEVGTLRRELRPPLRMDPRVLQMQDPASLLRSLTIDNVAFGNFDADNPTRSAVMRILVQSQQPRSQPWSLTYADGRTVLFAWDTAQPALDFNGLAFNPHRQPSVTPTPAPSTWELYWQGEPPLSLASRQADFYLTCHDVLAAQIEQVYKVLRQQQPLQVPPPPLAAYLFTGQLAASAPGNAGALAGVSVASDIEWSRQLTHPDALAPPGLPLLALRAARRGIRDHFTDVLAWRSLAGAYNNLLRQEGFWLGREPQDINSKFQELRRGQWISALHMLLQVQPDNYDMHRLLGILYLKNQLFDAALAHITQARDLMGEVAARGPVADIFKTAQKDIERLQKELAQDVQQRRDYFDGRSAQLNLAGKVNLALEVPIKTNNPKAPFVAPGLALLALELLREGKPEQLNLAELRFCALVEIRTLLALGRAEEAAERLRLKDMPGVLGGPVYLQFLAQAAAMLGDHATFDAVLQQLDGPLLLTHTSLILEAALSPIRPGPHALGDVPRLFFWEGDLRGRIFPQLAEHRLLRGLIALEGGNISLAEQMLRQFLSMLPPGVYHPERPLAVEYLRRIEKYRR